MACLGTRWMGMCVGETGVNDCQSEDTRTHFGNLFIATVRRGSHLSYHFGSAFLGNGPQSDKSSLPMRTESYFWGLARFGQPSKVQSLTIYRLKEAESNNNNNNSSNDDDMTRQDKTRQDKTSKKKKKKKKKKKHVHSHDIVLSIWQNDTKASWYYITCMQKTYTQNQRQ